jgi:DNA-3-methyladenine glycosylase II
MNPDLLAKASRHLSRRDPVLKRLRKAIGPCTLQIHSDGFQVLARAIVSQMIATKVALVIYDRLRAALPRRRMTPRNLLAAAPAALRGAGLSATKVQALRDLAERAVSGVLPLGRRDGLSDDEVIEHLVQVRGIGRWTAEMFLIFSLGRPDVLPVGDFGLRAGVRTHYQLEELPNRAALTALAEPWRPYRTVATWYFWRSFGAVPQS